MSITPKQALKALKAYERFTDIAHRSWNRGMRHVGTETARREVERSAINQEKAEEQYDIVEAFITQQITS